MLEDAEEDLRRAGTRTPAAEKSSFTVSCFVFFACMTRAGPLQLRSACQSVGARTAVLASRTAGSSTASVGARCPTFSNKLGATATGRVAPARSTMSTRRDAGEAGSGRGLSQPVLSATSESPNVIHRATDGAESERMLGHRAGLPDRDGVLGRPASRPRPGKPTGPTRV